MRVKRFVATNIEEAMAKIKKEMGNNAVILHTRYFKEGGFLGFFKKSYVEVTAATEDTDSPIRAKITSPVMDLPVQPPTPAPAQPTNANFLNVLQTQVENQAAQTAATETPNYSIPTAVKPAAQVSPLIVPQRELLRSDVEITADLTDMKSLMSEMTQILEDTSTVSHFPKLGQNLFLRLKRQEVEEKLAKRIVKATLQQIALNPSCNEDQLESIFMSNILKLLKKNKPINFSNSALKKPKIFAMIGPTGVGKTTTIAKLAAMYAIMERKKVAFVTVDTYRIAAVEQLRTIAEIMDVPVSVVYSIAQMRDCLLEVADRDIIFIDTAGRSHKNAVQLAELKVYLDVSCPDETFLVLSSTSKYQDMLDILNAYQEFNIRRLIFTKLDETSFYGSIYNIACRSKVPLSYITNGQNIPDDIEAADPVKLVQLLMKE